MDHRFAIFLLSFDAPLVYIRKAWRTQRCLKDISGFSCSLPYFGRHFSEESSFETLCGRAVTSKCYQFKEMHSAAYLAAVKGPGLVLWKSTLEPEWFSPWNAALTIWFRQFWCMSSIIRSASSTIWVHKDENHHLLNTGIYFLLFSFVSVTSEPEGKIMEASSQQNCFPCPSLLQVCKSLREKGKWVGAWVSRVGIKHLILWLLPPQSGVQTGPHNSSNREVFLLHTRSKQELLL